MDSFRDHGVHSSLLKALQFNLQGAGHARKDKSKKTNLQQGKTSNQGKQIKKYKTGH